jgi:hypothetical protein
LPTSPSPRAIPLRPPITAHLRRLHALSTAGPLPPPPPHSTRHTALPGPPLLPPPGAMNQTPPVLPLLWFKRAPASAPPLLSLPWSSNPVALSLLLWRHCPPPSSSRFRAALVETTTVVPRIPFPGERRHWSVSWQFLLASPLPYLSPCCRYRLPQPPSTGAPPPHWNANVSPFTTASPSPHG